MNWLERWRAGTVIPAHPLAIGEDRRIDERRQRALTRYYLDAGAGGIAVGVHTTQFAIRDPRHNLLKPVLEIAADELRYTNAIRIAGICGCSQQAMREAELAVSLGYHAGLVSLGALREARDYQLLKHIREIAEVIPVVGFYLQPAVGGRMLPHSFWRRAVEIDNLIGIKVAPFNRYQTIDVVRAVAASGRAGEIALYTGNDDNIVADLTTPFCFDGVTVRFVGGLLGQWAVWTRKAVELHAEVTALARAGDPIPSRLLALGQELTDANSALFDGANGFRGCIAGIHEALRRQGLLEGCWCLDPEEGLSPGQMEEIDRVIRAYPHLTDDDFVRENLDRWLAGSASSKIATSAAD